MSLLPFLTRADASTVINAIYPEYAGFIPVKGQLYQASNTNGVKAASLINTAIQSPSALSSAAFPGWVSTRLNLTDIGTNKFWSPRPKKIIFTPSSNSPGPTGSTYNWTSDTFSSPGIFRGALLRLNRRTVLPFVTQGAGTSGPSYVAARTGEGFSDTAAHALANAMNFTGASNFFLIATMLSTYQSDNTGVPAGGVSAQINFPFVGTMNEPSTLVFCQIWVGNVPE